jgi:hypothetical protein
MDGKIKNFVIQDSCMCLAGCTSYFPLSFGEGEKGGEAKKKFDVHPPGLLICYANARPE